MRASPYVLVVSDREDVYQLVRDTLGPGVAIDTPSQKSRMSAPPSLVVADLTDRPESLVQSIWTFSGAPVVVVVNDEATGMKALSRGATQAIVTPVDHPAARLALRSVYAAQAKEDVVGVPREESQEPRHGVAEHRVEEQLQHSARLATIGEISAAVAHEINNPLQFMSVCLDELRALLVKTLPGHASSEHRALLDDALEGVERIRSITVELLPFARSSPSAIEDVDLNQVLMRALRMMRNDLRHRAQIVCDLDQVPLLRGDPRRLAQVFTNVLLNAAQAIEEGKADDNTIAVLSRRDGDEIHVTVRDTGRGIPADHLPRVFERFFTTKPSGMGTGLGMSVSQEIVRAHGGHIYVESDLGQGTEVTIILPVRTTLAAVAEAAAPVHRGPRALKILAVDDDLLVLKSYRRTLGKQHVMMFAGDGADALALLDLDASFDAILCDLMMPNMDGRRFYEELERRHPKLLNRVVFCSGGTFTAGADQFVKSCERPVLSKPIPPDELLDVLLDVAAKADEDADRAPRLTSGEGG